MSLFKEAFLKAAFPGAPQLSMPMPMPMPMPALKHPHEDHTSVNFRKGLMVGGLAGVLEGASEAVASHASPRRALTLGLLTAGLGASEAVHLGDNATTGQKMLHTGVGAALGGGIGYYLGGEHASQKRRLIAAGLGALSTGLMSSM